MSAVSFIDNSFRVAPFAGGERHVVLDTLVSAVDARALADALAWQRARDFLPTSVESGDQVLALRAIMTLTDLLDTVVEGGAGAPLTLTRPQVALLAEAASRYVTERDTDGYAEPRERDRIVRLRTLCDRLFDRTADLAGAEDEVAAQSS